MLWNIARCNIYTTIMSDILHQIKIGVWSHLMNWFEHLIRHIYNAQEANIYLDELDKRIALVPPFPGIKRFPKGISNLKYITAGENAHIMKVRDYLSRY